MAIFGWRTIKQAEAYTRAAERKRLDASARNKKGRNVSHLGGARGAGGKERGKKVNKNNARIL
jgi:hypothetical protein